MTKFDKITREGEERIRYASTTRGQVQPNFGGSLLFMHTPFDAELPNLTW